MRIGIPKIEGEENTLSPHQALLVYAPLGMDVSVFAKQIAYTNLLDGSKVFYLLLNKRPSALHESLTKFSWNQDVFKNLHVVDGFSSTTGLPPETPYWVDTTSIEDTINKLAQYMQQQNASILIIEDLADLFARNKEWHTALSRLKTLGCIVFVYTDLNLQPSLTKTIFDMSEFVIRISMVEERLLLRNYYRLAKSPHGDDPRHIPFRVGSDGISIYIPKILVTGPFHAGKSTFIRKLSKRSVSVDRMGTTIALDHGFYEGRGFSADLFGTPGQERFDFMLDILNVDTFGVILVVDSTNPDEFERAKTMLERVGGYGIPFVIAANKQDLEGALLPEQIVAELGIPHADIVPTIATEGKGVSEALERLIDKILGEHRV